MVMITILCMTTDDLWRTMMTMVIISHPLPDDFCRRDFSTSRLFAHRLFRAELANDECITKLHTALNENDDVKQKKTRDPFLENVSKFQI